MKYSYISLKQKKKKKKKKKKKEAMLHLSLDCSHDSSLSGLRITCSDKKIIIIIKYKYLKLIKNTWIKF
jgi:hypothetical protein